METQGNTSELFAPSSDSVTAQQDQHALGSGTFVVGIGASAGGLEAIEHFFDNMPDTCGLTFVVVQHLSPDFKSLMDELLARHTKMPIHRVENGMSIQPNAIYLIPRKKNMALTDGKLWLTDQDHKSGPNLPIDVFFHSLAHDMGDKAIAVVLSGTGSDGSRGVKAIHEAGGLVIVQDPETAAFDGMPKAAIATGLADLVLPPVAMPAKIAQYASHPVRSEIRKSRLDLQSGDELTSVFSLLRRHFGVDFALYKPSTLARRLERRMTLRDVAAIHDYLALIETDSDELDQLYRDFLVEVTQFFRDRDAFDSLKNEVIPKLVEQATTEDGLRIWVPGCATGEEAYSLAMLFNEAVQSTRPNLDVKIFATDVHRTSLEIAGAGAFREASVSEVPRPYLDRYFVRKRGQFVVNQELRKLVIFAPHNLTKDPPFTKLDLITCRNVLIYFNPATQKKVLSLFHFGLRTGGVLFLGPSESIGELENEFDVIDRHWKMFRKRRDVRLHPSTGLATMPLSETAMLFRNQISHGQSDNQVPEIYEQLLNRYLPPSLLLNEHRELVHTFGDARNYLQVPEGKATNDVLKMLDEPLRIAVSSALHQASKGNLPVVYTGVRTTLHDQDCILKVSVIPLPNKRTQSNFYQVCFEAEAAPATPTPSKSFDVQGESAERISGLERELMYTKEHLQSTIEELETSNEELQSTNEELVASNEELQSTNEELHSVNEELYTVNAEHQRKIDELIQLTNDMDNLLASTDIGTIFLDLELNIRKFTPAINRLFNILPHDIGRPLQHLSNNLGVDISKLIELIEATHVSGRPQELEVASPKNGCILVRVLPYVAQNQVVSGTVLTFVDISAVKKVKQELGDSERRFEAVLQNSTALIFVKDLDGRYVLANKRFFELLPDQINDVIGKTDHNLFPAELAQARRDFDARVQLEGVPSETEELYHTRQGHRTFLTIRFPLRDGNNRVYAVAGISTDITSRKHAENEARDAIMRRDQFLAMLSHELRNPLSAISTATQVLSRTESDQSAIRNAREVIHRQVEQMSRLLDDLLDVTRIAQNRIRLQTTACDFRRIVNDALAVVRPSFDSAGVTLTIELGDSPVTVLGDEARLQQMLVNLLLNAAKYTPVGGEVHLTAAVVNECAVIRIKDTGVGIRKEMLKKVFDLFVQANETLARSEGGMGVGLTLVKTIVEMHGGSVEAQSDGIGQGSEFVVRLPIAHGDPPTTTPVSNTPTNRMNILVVEDNADSRRMLQAMLQLDGYTVQTASNGREGLDAIFETRPRVAIIDIGLPEIDGYELARRVRTQLSHDEILLIALTGYGRPDDHRAVLEAGFDEHLVKPLDPLELERILGNVCLS